MMLADFITVLIALLALYFIILSFYRLCFHPLRSIPGPKLAALSLWYEFYYDCIKGGGGKFSGHIRHLYSKYGSIVRISPNHVHINDPVFFDVLYNNSLRLNRDPFYYRGLGTHETVVSTIDADVHRTRRGAFNKYFSKANVVRLDGRIEAVVGKLCTRLEEHRASRQTINLSDAARAFTTDAVVTYLIGDQDHTNLLDTADLGAPAHRGLRLFTFFIPWQRQFPWVLPSLRVVRDFMTRSGSRKSGPSDARTLIWDPSRDLKKMALQYAHDEKEDSEEARQSNIFRTIYASPSLSAADKSPRRAAREVTNLMGAGRETTGNVLAYLCYAILQNGSVLRSLKAELEQAAADVENPYEQTPIPAKKLAELPFLSAIIKEGLRLRPLTGRLPRYHPTTTLTYTTPHEHTFSLPPGTTVSMTPADILHNADIFKDPQTFDPKRWLEGRKSELERYMVTFGRGPQMCIGLELAKREMAVFVGTVFGRFNFEMVDTVESDVGIEHDFFMGISGKSARGVRAKVI